MKNILVSALVAALVAILVTLFFSKAPTSATVQTAYDRVVQNNTLRCGYGTWEPGVYKDPQTGKMTGLFVELIEAIGTLNGMKIEWTAEIDWGHIPEAIQSGKIDAFCAGMADDASRGKVLAYTTPLSYWTFDALVRADDARFPEGEMISLAELNKEEYATSYTEGDVLQTLVKTELPAVRGVPLPPLGTPADNTMNLVSKKTDFAIFPKVMFYGYEKQSPGVLRYLKIEPPLRTYGNVIAVGIGDTRLQQLLNAGIYELTNSTKYREIMHNYDKLYPGAFHAIGTAHYH